MDNKEKELFKLKAQVIQALAHPARLAIVDFLKDGPQCVCKIAELFESDRSNISKHLSLMTKAGILDSRKEGLYIYYSLKILCVVKFLGCVEDALKEIGRASCRERV